MISEVLNALFITYVGTEYLLDGVSTQKRLTKRKSTFAILAFIVVFVNFIDRVTGAADVVNEALKGFLHTPRVVFAAVVYVVALYYDCRRVSRATLTLKTFLPLVGKAFLRVLPAYPFLAVAISFVFMIVINIFEALHLPLEILNWPIYYGTLYGPFSFVYWKVKERVVDESFNTLPRTKTPW